jgi:hypothetical protein
MTSLLKAATRELVLACRGSKVVQGLVNVSPGQVSRWEGDAYPDMIPLWAVGLLEFHCQAPVFTRALAGLTGHQLVPIGDDDGGDGDHVSHLVGVTAAAAGVTSTMAANLADGRVTPGEAKAGLASIGVLERKLDGAKRRLAVVAGGGQ